MDSLADDSVRLVAVTATSAEPQPGTAVTILPDWAIPAVKPIRSDWPENRRRFVLGVTDSDGVTGEFGPCSATTVELVRDQVGPAVVGRPVGQWRDFDALCTPGRHQEGAHLRIALSAMELAVWDLRGKRAGVPAHRLLGGAQRLEIPAYATALGIDIDHALAGDVAKWIVQSGFWGQKWSLPGADRQEPASLDADRLLLLREASGPHARLMVDGLRRWTPGRLLELLPVLQECRIEWLEEPLLCADAVPAGCGVPIAGGEHAFDRHDQVKQLTSGRIQIWQPELAWCGGLARSLSTTQLATDLGIPTFPHATGLSAALHLAAALPAVTAVEYHLTLDPIRHSILENPPPVNMSGAFPPPFVPGLAGPYRHAADVTHLHLAGADHAI